MDGYAHPIMPGYGLDTFMHLDHTTAPDSPEHSSNDSSDHSSPSSQSHQLDPYSFAQSSSSSSAAPVQTAGQAQLPKNASYGNLDFSAWTVGEEEAAAAAVTSSMGLHATLAPLDIDFRAMMPVPPPFTTASTSRSAMALDMGVTSPPGGYAADSPLWSNLQPSTTNVTPAPVSGWMHNAAVPRSVQVQSSTLQPNQFASLTMPHVPQGQGGMGAAAYSGGMASAGGGVVGAGNGGMNGLGQIPTGVTGQMDFTDLIRDDQYQTFVPQQQQSTDFPFGAPPLPVYTSLRSQNAFPAVGVQPYPAIPNGYTPFASTSTSGAGDNLSSSFALFATQAGAQPSTQADHTAWRGQAHRSAPTTPPSSEGNSPSAHTNASASNAPSRPRSPVILEKKEKEKEKKPQQKKTAIKKAAAVLGVGTGLTAGAGASKTPTVGPLNVDRRPPREVMRDIQAREKGELEMVVSGMKTKGARARVEVLTKMNMSLVAPNPAFELDTAVDAEGVMTPEAEQGLIAVGSWQWIRLPPRSALKRKHPKCFVDPAKLDPENVLELSAKVVMQDTKKPVFGCKKCMMRELVAEKRREGQRVRQKQEVGAINGCDDHVEIVVDVDDAAAATGDDEQKAKMWHPERIIVFNCGEYLDFSSGTVELPARITCYSRDHGEASYQIEFTLRDRHGRQVASGVTPPLYVTDDHKSHTRPSLTASSRNTSDESLDDSAKSSKAGKIRKKRKGDVTAEGEDAADRKPRRKKPYDAKDKPVRKSRSERSLAMTPMTPVHARSSLSLSGSGSVTPMTSTPLGLTLQPLSPAHTTAEASWQAGMDAASRQQFNASRRESSTSTSASFISPAMSATSLPPSGSTTSTVPSSASSPQSGGGSSHPSPPAAFEPTPTFAQQYAAEPQQYVAAAQNGPRSLSYHLAELERASQMASRPQPPSPRITAIGPANGERGTMIRIEGQNFSSDWDFYIGDAQAYAATQTSSSASIYAPQQPRLGIFTVSIRHRPTGRMIAGPEMPTFEYVSNVAGMPPRIEDISPASGDVAGGVHVYIMGPNLTSDLIVMFGDAPAEVVSQAGYHIVVRLPPATGPGPVPVSLQGLPPQIPNPIFTYEDNTPNKALNLSMRVAQQHAFNQNADPEQMVRLMAAGGVNFMSQPHFNRDAFSAGYTRHTPRGFESSLIQLLTSLDVRMPQSDDEESPSKSEQDLLDVISLADVHVHTLLHYAAILGFHRLASVLIVRGINLDKADVNGYTALHFAAARGRTIIVRRLLQAGASPFVRNRLHRTALDEAIFNDQEDVVAMLRRRRSPSLSREASIAGLRAAAHALGTSQSADARQQRIFAIHDDDDDTSEVEADASDESDFETEDDGDSSDLERRLSRTPSRNVSRLPSRNASRQSLARLREPESMADLAITPTAMKSQTDVSLPAGPSTPPAADSATTPPATTAMPSAYSILSNLIPLTLPQIPIGLPRGAGDLSKWNPVRSLGRRARQAEDDSASDTESISAWRGLYPPFWPSAPGQANMSVSKGKGKLTPVHQTNAAGWAKLARKLYYNPPTAAPDESEVEVVVKYQVYRSLKEDWRLWALWIPCLLSVILYFTMIDQPEGRLLPPLPTMNIRPSRFIRPLLRFPGLAN